MVRFLVVVMRLVLTYLVACTDPLCCAFTGGDLSILTILNHAMISDIAFKIGDMYGAFDEDGTMVGFQAWVPPGKALFESRVSGEQAEIPDAGAEVRPSRDKDKEQLGPYIARLPTDEIKAFVLHSVRDKPITLAKRQLIGAQMGHEISKLEDVLTGIEHVSGIAPILLAERY